MTVYFFMKFIIDNNGQLWVQLMSAEQTCSAEQRGFIDIITLENLHRHLYKRIKYTLILMSANLLISTVLLLQRWWVDTYKFFEPQIMNSLPY